MKKLLLISLVAAGAASLQAQTQADYKWCSTYDDGAPTCNVNTVCPAGDGNFFMAGTIGANATTLHWNEQDITPAGGMNVTYQKGFTIGKVSATGSMLWSVTSNTANVANNDIFLAPTPDGGVVMACNATYGKDGNGAPTLITLCGTGDTEPLTIGFDNHATGKSPYYGVIIKLDKDGAINWYHLLAANPFGGPAGDLYEAKPVSFKSLAVDAQGNVYAGGLNKTAARYDTAVSDALIPASANSAVNAKGTGLTDGSSGFILKYEPAEGHHAVNAPKAYWQNNATTPYAGQESVCGLTCKGNTLYFAMTVNGLQDAEYRLGGVEVAIDNTLNGNVVYGAIDATEMRLMSANALKATKGNGTTHVTQLKSLQLAGDRLAVCMSLNGGFEQGTNTLTASSTGKLEGATVLISTATLNAERGYCTGKNIGGDYLAIIDEGANTLYTIGYVMTDGILLHSFDLNTTDYKGATKLAEEGTVYSALFDSSTKDLLVSAYAKKLGKLCGTETASPEYSAFHGFLLAANLPQVNGVAGIDTLPAAESTDAPVEYYNLQGIRVLNPAPGTLVIRRQGDAVTKTVLR